MPISLSTFKRLYLKSGCRCAMPACRVSLLQGGNVLAEICHIRARRKGGARYDAALTAKQKDELQNLILLCPTCHTLIDKDPGRFPSELLEAIKAAHERGAEFELSGKVASEAELMFEKLIKGRRVKASAKGQSVSVAIGGDNHGPIHINNSRRSPEPKSKYPANSIGADANLTNYIDYLCDLYVKYMKLAEPDEGRRHAMIGTAIKRRYRLKKRTRNHIAAENFQDLVWFITTQKLPKTPVGKKLNANGHKLFSTFEEFRFNPK